MASQDIQDPDHISRLVVPNHNDDLTADDAAGLAAIGKTQAFTRKFNFWTALAITVCINATWEGISTGVLSGLASGGSAGLLYGYLLTCIGMTCVAAAVAELASIWPSSGAQYHWTAELAPPRFRPFLSWIVGFLTFAYIWMATTMCAMTVSIQVQAYIIVSNTSYVPERWHTYLIYVATMVVYLLINLFATRAIHHLGLIGIGTHIVGFFLIMIVLLVMTKDKHDASFVFTAFFNSSGWTNKGLAFCIGLTTPMFGFSGIEMAAHFAEEIRNVRKSLPRAIIWTIAINAIMTFPWLIAILYCSGDITAVVSGPIGLSSPMTQIFINGTGKIALSIFMSCFLTYNAVVGGTTGLGSCARTMFAIARDDCLPPMFKKVHPRWDVPVQCIIAAWIPQVLIGLIYIGNTTAFYSIVGCVISLYMLSYSVPLALHLFYARRHKNIEYGPWNLGRWSVPLNAVAFVWVCFISIFLCFPIYRPVTSENMNYAIVILAASLTIGISWYVFYLRGRYLGPVVEIAVDDESVIVAKMNTRETTVEASGIRKRKD